MQWNRVMGRCGAFAKYHVLKKSSILRYNTTSHLYFQSLPAATTPPTCFGPTAIQKCLMSIFTIKQQHSGKIMSPKDSLVDDTDMEALIRRTQDFVPMLLAFYDDSRRENFQLLTEWRHVLFYIPPTEQVMLKQCAESIDALLHANLDHQLSETGGGEKGRDNLRDFVATGIYAWGRLARIEEYSVESPERADALMAKLEQVNRMYYNDSSEVLLDAAVYSAMVYCWSQAVDNASASDRALHWFRQLQTIEFNHGSRRLGVVKSETWTALLRILVKQGRFHEKETQDLLKIYRHLNNGYTFVSLVKGWMQEESKDPNNGLKQAYDVLQQGISHCLQQDSDSQMNALYQLLFDFLSQSVKNDDDGGLSISEQVLQQMIVLQQDRPHRPLLQRKHFVVVMRVLASRGEAEKVQRLFQTMRSLHEQTGNPQMEPDYQTLVILMSALAKTLDPRHLRSVDKLLQLTENHLLSRASPKNPLSTSSSVSNHAYNVVLDFYSKVVGVKDRRSRIESLMARMEEWSEHLDNLNLLPDRISYAALLQAIVEEREYGFAKEVDDIVRKLELSHRPSLLPDRNIYAIALDAFSSSGNKKEALSLAKELFRRIQRDRYVLPDDVLYTLLMKIYSLAGDADGSNRILFEMIDAFENQGQENCCPTEVSFVTAISSWERSNRHDAPESALALFNTMMKLYEKGHKTCRPGQKTFGQLMVILAKSKHPSKWRMGRGLLGKMKELGLEPDVMILNWYIRVCGTGSTGDEKNRHKCWEDAQATWNVLRDRLHGANSQTYTSMLHACHNLVDDAMLRLDEMKVIFDQCKEDGLVDRQVIATLKQLIPSQEYEEWTLMNSREKWIDMRKIPQKWRPNTPRR